MRGRASSVLTELPGARLPVRAVAVAGEEGLAAGGDGLDESVYVGLGPRPRALEAGETARPRDEQPVQQKDMEVQVEVQRAAEALDDGHAARSPGAGEGRSAGEQPAPGPGDGQDELPHGDAGEKLVGPAVREGRHAPAAARRAEAAPLAGERHQPVVVSLWAAEPREAVGRVAAADEGAHLAGDEPRQVAVVGVQPVPERSPASGDDPVEVVAWRVGAVESRRRHAVRSSTKRADGMVASGTALSL